MWRCLVLSLVISARAQAKLDSEERQDDDTAESAGEHDLDDDDIDRIGAAVTQVVRHPYAASLLKNDTYFCSAVILNTYWLVTESKCFDPAVVTTYVAHRNLTSYSVRVGSSYNTKGGAQFKINMLINNFDFKISAVKLQTPLEYSSRVAAARLPAYDEDVTLGYLASIVAWTPGGHMRVVNAPIIEASICEGFTKLQPGNYVCLGGVQDLNRHFCRRDNGGAVIQNNTLIAISSYIHSCALYTRTHAFPKVSTFARWLDSIIWDEESRPTTTEQTTMKTTAAELTNNRTQYSTTENNFLDQRMSLMSLPFAPINVPLQPDGESVLPRMSLYESYLQSVARAKTMKTSTTEDPKVLEAQKRSGLQKQWLKKYGNVMMPSQLFPSKRLW